MSNDENTPDLGQDENEAQEVETTDSSEEFTSDDIDWKAEAEKSKAEALKYKAILDRNKNKMPKESTRKSDDFGYDVKAYLKSSGIQSSEFDFVKSELKQAGGDLDSLLDNDYFKSRLEKHRALTRTAEATPRGSRNGGVPTDSVDYWMSKDIKDVPSDMRAKVVNARIAKEKSKGVFYNS